MLGGLCGQKSCSDGLKSHPRAAISKPAKKVVGVKRAGDRQKDSNTLSLFSAIVPFYNKFNSGAGPITKYDSRYTRVAMFCGDFEPMLGGLRGLR